MRQHAGSRGSRPPAGSAAPTCLIALDGVQAVALSGEWLDLSGRLTWQPWRASGSPGGARPTCPPLAAPGGKSQPRAAIKEIEVCGINQNSLEVVEEGDPWRGVVATASCRGRRGGVALAHPAGRCPGLAGAWGWPIARGPRRVTIGWLPGTARYPDNFGPEDGDLQFQRDLLLARLPEGATWDGPA